ncbi:MAG: cellulase family glycosylhydrolase [Acidobacteriota bacterium]
MKTVFGFTLLIAALILSADASAQQCSCISVHPVTIGVNVQNPPIMSKARAANLGWVRVGVLWSEVETTQGNWDFAGDDADIRDATAAGLKVLVILFHTPGWAGGGANHNIPAANIALWEEYVRRVAQRYNGSDPTMKVDAYEIWNEPDLVNSGDGIGWNYDISAYPRYVDYVHSAAVQIRTWAPGAKVVAGAYSAGGSSGSSSTTRIRLFSDHLEHTNYADGNASDFVDVMSLHANGMGSEYSDNTTDRAKFRIDDMAMYNPRNACKPKWITEFGFASALVGESSQKDRIKRMVEMFAGTHYSSNCTGWTRGTHNVEIAFIYVQLDFGTLTRGIHRVDQSPKPVVTQYLQLLPYPAADY